MPEIAAEIPGGEEVSQLGLICEVPEIAADGEVLPIRGICEEPKINETEKPVMIAEKAEMSIKRPLTNWSIVLAMAIEHPERGMVPEQPVMIAENAKMNIKRPITNWSTVLVMADEHKEPGTDACNEIPHHYKVAIFFRE